MRRLLPLLLSVLLLAGCASPAAPKEEGAKRYEATFLTLFDTVTTVVGYAESEEDFQATAQSLHDALLEYHQLYDIYSDYDGVVNLKAVNDAAGGAPVVVDRKIIDLLLFCRDLCEGTGGQVNAALGGVLALWHDAREAGISDPASAALPDAAALAEAARHADFSSVIIDEAASTVQITDPALRLDVGAIAKGYAVEQVCRAAPDGLLLSVGGNVRATGPKPGGENWVVGIQAPGGESGAFLHTLYVRDVSVVTSGDYQRYYTVGGVRYHHIIDPKTGKPAESGLVSVTVVCGDGAWADALSTACFVLGEAGSLALRDTLAAEKNLRIELILVTDDGHVRYTAGLAERFEPSEEGTYVYEAIIA